MSWTLWKISLFLIKRYLPFRLTPGFGRYPQPHMSAPIAQGIAADSVASFTRYSSLHSIL